MYKDLMTTKEKLGEYEAADAKRKEQEALAKGEYEKVLAGLKPKAERHDRLESALNVYLENEVNSLPEEWRDAVPAGNVEDQIEWVAKNKSKILKTSTPSEPQQPVPGTNNAVPGSKIPTDIKPIDYLKKYHQTRDPAWMKKYKEAKAASAAV
jgi:hypothetical protein